jgi:hypothetical protein
MILKRALFLLVLVLALGAIPLKAQDETPGSQSTITASIASGGFSCGRASYPAYCYGVPALGGTFWLDVYYNAYPHANGFIAFNNVADLGYSTVVAASVVKDASGLVTELDVSFAGVTNDGDNGTYSGTGKFVFSYYKMSSGSGRGGGYPGYVQILQSATLTINYN